MEKNLETVADEMDFDNNDGVPCAQSVREDENARENPDVGELGVTDLLTKSMQLEQTDGHTEAGVKDSDEEEPSLNYELQQGYRILKELIAESNKSVNWPFIYKVDDTYPETSDYYEKIKHPMWLDKMREKFTSKEYETITQFVTDFRLMLENCYRYNGPDHYVSKRGQKLETMLEQKLALLSREIREKTSITATSGQIKREDSPVPGLRRRTKNVTPHDSSALLNQLREQEAQTLREARKQQMIDRKAALEAYQQELIDWENNIMDNKVQEMKSMWELPQIGLFLFLCQEPLNIGEISQFELERCFYIPKESSTMQLVMTSLLSTPFQRTRIDKKELMSYRVWDEKLRVKFRQWYKTLTDLHSDVDKAAEKLGLDPDFFRIVGMKNPLEKKKFHKLSVYKRVWIVKSLCDWCLEHQESLRDTMETQPVEEQRCYQLGMDAMGNNYIHFPQFCGADLRIYKQTPLPDPTVFFKGLIEKHELEMLPTKKTPVKDNIIKKSSKKFKKKKSRPLPDIPAPPTNRPSRLRQKIKTVLPVQNYTSSSSSSSSSESDDEDDGNMAETEGQSDSTFNDSGISENTPAKCKRTLINPQINRVIDHELYSDSSSMDSENGAWRRRSSRLLRNGLMKQLNNVEDGDTSYDKFDSVSENSHVTGLRDDDNSCVSKDRTNNSTPVSDIGLRGDDNSCVSKDRTNNSTPVSGIGLRGDDNSCVSKDRTNNSTPVSDIGLRDDDNSCVSKDRTNNSTPVSDIGLRGDDNSCVSKDRTNNSTPVSDIGLRDDDNSCVSKDRTNNSTPVSDIGLRDDDNSCVSKDRTNNSTPVSDIGLRDDDNSCVSKDRTNNSTPVSDIGLRDDDNSCVSKDRTNNSTPVSDIGLRDDDNSCVSKDRTNNSTPVSDIGLRDDDNSCVSKDRTNNSTPVSDIIGDNQNDRYDSDKSSNSSKITPCSVKDKGGGDTSICGEKYSMATCSSIDSKGDRVIDYNKLCDAIDSVMSNGLDNINDDTSRDSSVGFSIDENAVCEDIGLHSKNGSNQSDVLDLSDVGQFSVVLNNKHEESCEIGKSNPISMEHNSSDEICETRTENISKHALVDSDNSVVNSQSVDIGKDQLAEVNNSQTSDNLNYLNSSNHNSASSKDDSETSIENPCDHNGSGSKLSDQNIDKGCIKSEQDIKSEITDENSESLSTVGAGDVGSLSTLGVADVGSLSTLGAGDVGSLSTLGVADVGSLSTLGAGVVGSLSTLGVADVGSLSILGAGDVGSVRMNIKQERHDNIDLDKSKLCSSEDNTSSTVNKVEPEEYSHTTTSEQKCDGDQTLYNTVVKQETAMEVKVEPVSGGHNVDEYKVKEIKLEPKDDGEETETMADSEEEDGEEITPEIGPFELLVEDVEGLRQLVNQFAEQEPVVIGKGKKQKVIKPPPRRKCVKELYERLQYLLKELEPWEAKLMQATKKARIKLKREHEEYEESQDTDEMWKTDNSETETEEEEGSNDDNKNQISEVDKIKPVIKTETPNIAGEKESYEMDVSLRGRLRKRRVIPNNVEDQAKKKKHNPVTTSTEPSHVPNILLKQPKTVQNVPQLGNIISCLDQLKVLNSGTGSDVGNQILIQTTQGGHALVTGLSPQILANLRLGSKGSVIMSSTTVSQKTPTQNDSLVSQENVLTLTSKQASHPVMQGLLSTKHLQPSPLQKTVSMVTESSDLTINVTRPSQPVIAVPSQKAGPTMQTKPQQDSKHNNQQGKMQYFAANINSLPPAVVQQLFKNKSLKGTTKSGMILLAVPQSSSGKDATPQVVLKDVPTGSLGVTTASAQGNEIQHNLTSLNPSMNITNITSANQTLILGSSSNSTQCETVFTVPPSVTSEIKPDMTASGMLKSVISSVNSQNLDEKFNIVTSVSPSVTGELGVSTVFPDVGTTMLAGNVCAVVSPGGSSSPLSPNKNVSKYSGSATVKSLLEARKDALRIEAQRQMALNRVVPTTSGSLQPVRTGGVQPVSVPSELLRKRSTVVLHPTASGIKALKIPSKAALDSAVQAVVTSVKTSLPTANIKVPSPVTMPSIQQRKIVTKTIQSMKAPIPTTPKVETKSAGSSHSLTTMLLSNQTKIASVDSLAGNQTVLAQIPSENNQYMLATVKKNSVGGFITNSYALQDQKNLTLKLLPKSGQSSQPGVVQGYLTPQGLVIPPQSSIQTQKPGNDAAQLSSQISGKQITVSNHNVLNPTHGYTQTVPTVTSSIHGYSQTVPTLTMSSGIHGYSQSVPTATVSSSIHGYRQTVPAVIVSSGIQGYRQTVSTVTASSGIGVKSFKNSQSASTILANSVQKGVVLNTASKVTSSLNLTLPTVSNSSSVTVSDHRSGSQVMDTLSPSNSSSINNKLVSGQLISALPQVASINPVPQSLVQLTTPVIGQMANPLGNVVLGQLASPTAKLNPIVGLAGLTVSPGLQIDGQQAVPIGSGTQLLGQPSLQIVSPPIPNIAHIIGQLTNASQLLSQPYLTTSSTPQVNVPVTSQQGTVQITTPNRNNKDVLGQTQLSVLSVDHQSTSTGTVKPLVTLSNVGTTQGQQAPLLSPSVKQAPVVLNSFGPGSSSELMKQLAAAKILENTQNQLTGNLCTQTNMPASNGSPHTATMPNHYFIPTTGTSQQGFRVQGQLGAEGQRQPVFLLSPQRGILAGNVQLTASSKLSQQAPAQMSPQLLISSTSSTFTPNVKNTSGQQMFPKVQLDFDLASSVTSVSTSKCATSVASTTIGQLQTKETKCAGFTVVKNNVAMSNGNVKYVHPSYLSSMDSKQAVKSWTVMTAPSTSTKPSPPLPLAPQTPQHQKLYLYNVGGQLVTPQGVPVTVDNGVLKVLPKSKLMIDSLVSKLKSQQSTEITTFNSPHSNNNVATNSAIVHSTAKILVNSGNKHGNIEEFKQQNVDNKQSLAVTQGIAVNVVTKPNTGTTGSYTESTRSDTATVTSFTPGKEIRLCSPDKQGVKRMATDLDTCKLAGVSPTKTSKIQHVPSHLSGSHLKISQILAQKSSVVAVPKTLSGALRLPGATTNKQSTGTGFVVMPGQTHVIFPHVSSATSTSCMIIPSSELISPRTSRATENCEPSQCVHSSISSSHFPSEINTTDTSKCTSSKTFNSGIVTLATGGTVNSSMVAVGEIKHTSVDSISSINSNIEVLGEQEAALNLLSLANQGLDNSGH